ncbi:MAG TPA: hypothetical protein DCG30_00675 [Ruminococcus sp.]|nr:hypothetical protein [Ruminococcus sp.]
MGNLVKMDFYRMRKSKVFIVNLIIIFVTALASAPFAKFMCFIANKLIKDVADSGTESQFMVFENTKNLSEIIASPFIAKPVFVLLFISVVSFTYSDIANGYVKNIAGQLPKRGYTVVSKFIVISIHNMIFMLVSACGRIISELTVRSIAVENISTSIVTFILKWLLLQSICTILLFLTTGLGNKTFASIVGVITGTGVLTGVYFAIDTAFIKIFHTSDTYLLNNGPDQLLSLGQVAIFNGLLVSGIIIAIFLPATIKIFNKKDVK